jgi:hypothetical protein
MKNGERKQAIQKVNAQHKAIAEFMLANPFAPTAVVAAHVSMSPQWVAQVRSSDAFKHYMSKLEEKAVASIAIPLRSRVHAVSERAVERLADAVELTDDPKFLLDVADKTLHRLGFAPSRGPEPTIQNNVQTNVYVADANALRVARERMNATSSGVAAPDPAHLNAPNGGPDIRAPALTQDG